jgi:hypothetical protein
MKNKEDGGILHLMIADRPIEASQAVAMGGSEELAPAESRGKSGE